MKLSQSSPAKLILFVLLLGLADNAVSWQNEFLQTLEFQCPTGQILSYLESEHDNDYQDRRWFLECDTGKANTSDCQWSGHGYVNDPDGLILYQCEGDSVIAGINAVHSQKHLDRRYKFLCCSAPNYVAHSCSYTDYENNLNGHLEYAVPKGKVLKGVYSHVDNGAEDRRFRFEVCEFDRIRRRRGEGSSPVTGR